MPDDWREDITLICQNASCGKEFTFSGGEQKFYQERGLNEPALCRECRQERNATQDYSLTCEACGFERTLRREYIISYRRNQGPWIPPTLCKMCEENPERAEAHRAMTRGKEKLNQFLQGQQEAPFQYLLDDRTGIRGFPQYLRTITKWYSEPAEDIQEAFLQDVSWSTGLTQMDVLADPTVYQTLSGGKDHLNRLNHIMEHFEGQDSYNVLDTLQDIAESTDTNQVVEFKDRKSDNFIKFDINSKTVLVLDEYQSPPPDFMIITAYQASNGFGYILNKINSGLWMPI